MQSYKTRAFASLSLIAITLLPVSAYAKPVINQTVPYQPSVPYQILPEGCFSGVPSQSGGVIISVKKMARLHYRVTEQSDLNFHGAVYSANPADYIITYDVRLAKSRRWFIGKQPRASISFSVDGIPRVALTRLSNRTVRYHRVIKTLGASDDFPGLPIKSKGTLRRDAGACSALE